MSCFFHVRLPSKLNQKISGQVFCYDNASNSVFSGAPFKKSRDVCTVCLQWPEKGISVTFPSPVTWSVQYACRKINQNRNVRTTFCLVLFIGWQDRGFPLLIRSSIPHSSVLLVTRNLRKFMPIAYKGKWTFKLFWSQDVLPKVYSN